MQSVTNGTHIGKGPTKSKEEKKPPDSPAHREAKGKPHVQSTSWNDRRAFPSMDHTISDTRLAKDKQI
jgi:hypothetical protein